MPTVSAKLSALKAKTADLIVTETKIPDVHSNTLDLFQDNSAAKADSANEWIIDLYPSQVTIFMYLLNMASTLNAKIDHKEHAKSSLPIVAMYLMTIYHGFFLLNDIHVRPSPSAHAQSWTQTSWKATFVQYLLTLPVPEFMEPIFKQLTATETERTKNVFLIPSAAGFQHDIFYGRFFPLNFFTHIHDCIATMPGNSTRMAIINDLMPRILYKLRPTAGNGFDSVLADLVGITPTSAADHHGHYCASKLYQVFTSIFNPVLFRDFHRRSSLSTIDLATPTFKTMTPNAYDVLFSATSLNLKELKVVLQSMTKILSPHVPMKRNLCQVIASGSGINAFAHGYSDFALPTWTSNMNLPAAAPFPQLADLKSETPLQRAERISFAQELATRPQIAAELEDVELSKRDGAANPDARVNRRFWPWSLLKVTDAADPRPKTADFVLATEDNIDLLAYPKVLVLDISGDKTTDAYLSTLTGKIIESFEIDGVTIEHPNATKSLGLQNCMFADSAIPYKYVLRSLRFYTRDKGTILPPLRRSPAVSKPLLPAATLLHNRLEIRLPELNKQVADSINYTGLPGFTKLADSGWIRYAQSFLGFRTVYSDNAAANDAVPHMENGRLHLFSPYSYTPYEDQEAEDLLPNMEESRHYFLTNLRTIFGTDFNLVELTHPFEAMPVV
nr:capsid protein [Sarcosphaera coronaria partitivirus]